MDGKWTDPALKQRYPQRHGGGHRPGNMVTLLVRGYLGAISLRFQNKPNHRYKKKDASARKRNNGTSEK
ncbi:hypothetical protein [Thiocapsa rosea]|uniref:Uncharacterized protein n=1 Tax=Thiocapsa rosea TaxID=69360 RepID=A0A495UZT8_9GAMM|nr:hypothetical protein [Thiocapsa rosea]RKT42752.1 hypothetical protein BDD21_0047 [Thiocapsa rosea]